MGFDREMQKANSLAVSSRTITLIRLYDYFGVTRFRRYVMGDNMSLSMSEVLARLLSKKPRFSF